MEDFRKTAQTHEAARGLLLRRGRASPFPLPWGTTRNIRAPPGERAVSPVTTRDSLQTKTRLIPGHKEELVQKDHQSLEEFCFSSEL